MKKVVQVPGQKSDKVFMLAVDLYLLRYVKKGPRWYELTDYLREKLIEDGHSIQYKKDTMIFNDFDIGNLCDSLK